MADRETMLKQINEISFTVNDLTLFLDTHPLDDNALKAFSDAMKQRKQPVSYTHLTLPTT